MTAFIIIIIAASLLGSILWIRPSQKEHLQMQMRLAARKENLSVQFTHIDLPDKWDKSKNKTKVTAYHKFRTKKLTALTTSINIYPYEIWKHKKVAEGWYASDQVVLSDTAKGILLRYQDYFKSIEISKDCVSLFWEERGDESSVHEISSLLTELELLSF